MKNFYKIPRAQLAIEAINAANAIANGKVSGFSPVQSAEISAELLADATLLQVDDETAVEKKAASITATGLAEVRKRRVATLMSAVKYSMLGVDSSRDEFDAVGFKPPADSRSAVTPQTPSGLAAYGGNGFVDLTWIGPNDPGSVTYIIWGRGDRSDPYSIIGICTSQKFRHQGVAPGQFFQYRIQAQASRGLVSGWSNEAVVYSPR